MCAPITAIGDIVLELIHRMLIPPNICTPEASIRLGAERRPASTTGVCVSKLANFRGILANQHLLSCCIYVLVSLGTIFFPASRRSPKPLRCTRDVLWMVVWVRFPMHAATETWCGGMEWMWYGYPKQQFFLSECRRWGWPEYGCSGQTERYECLRYFRSFVQHKGPDPVVWQAHHTTRIVLY